MGKTRYHLDPRARFADEAAPVIAARLDEMFTEEAGTRSGDVEALHDMRVASRRLREAMNIFAPCFRRRAYGPLQKAARTLTRALGTVRDRDVLIEHLEGYRRDLPSAEQVGIDDLLELVRAERLAEREALIAALDDVDRGGFRHRVKLILGQKSARASNTGANGIEPRGSVREAAQQIGMQRAADLYRYAPAIHDPALVDELHRMRIAAKHLRYTLEIFKPCFPAQVDGCIDQVKEIQDQIGQIHDRDVLAGLLQSHLAVLAQREHRRLLAVLDASPQETRAACLQEAIVGDSEHDERLGILVLLGRTRDERAQRYTAFTAWWDAADAAGLRQNIYETIGTAGDRTGADEP